MKTSDQETDSVELELEQRSRPGQLQSVADRSIKLTFFVACRARTGLQRMRSVKG